MLKPEVERKVLLFLRKIPRGRVVTYKSVGDMFKLHPRVIGLIMSRNKHPNIFQCFKVVKSDGQPGGYSLGMRKKAELLRKEGVKFRGRINLKKYFWS